MACLSRPISTGLSDLVAGSFGNLAARMVALLWSLVCTSAPCGDRGSEVLV